MTVNLGFTKTENHKTPQERNSKKSYKWEEALAELSQVKVVFTQDCQETARQNK